MSNLSDLLPAGAAAKQLTFTDSGSGITSKKPVVLESDGDVTQVSETATSESAGTPASYVATLLPSYYALSAGYDTNRNVHFWSSSGDPSGSYTYYPKFNCATLSGSTFTLRSTTTVLSNDQTGNQMVTCFHPPSNLVVFFNAENEQNYVMPITIGSNGTSVTLGSTNQSLGLGGYGTKGYPVQAVYDEDSEWIVMMMVDITTRPRLVAVKPSGSGASASISVGTSNQIHNDTIKYPTLYYDKSQNKIVAGYTDDNQSNKFYLHEITVNSSTGALSSGTRVVLSSDAQKYSSMVYDENAERGIYFGGDGTSSADAFQAMAIQLSSGSFTVGTALAKSDFSGILSTGGETVRTRGQYSKGRPIIYHPTAKKTYFFYRQQTSSYLGAWAITCSGNTLTAGSMITTSSTALQRGELGLSYDPDTEYIGIFSSAYASSSNQQYFQAYRPAYSTTNLTATNFVGIADSALGAGAAGSVIVQGGTVTGLSSLTAGSNYYVQPDGTFNTSAGSPSVKAGLAISTTALLLNGDS